MNRTVHPVAALTAAILCCGCVLACGPARAAFEQGDGLDGEAAVESIRVTLHASPDAELREPIALDLGLGFPLWLHPLGRVAALTPFGAVPQESTAGTRIPAGGSASFAFRLEGEPGQDRLQTTPALLAGVRLSDIDRIELQSTAAEPPAIAGYEIQVNGQLLAANDAVAPKRSAGEDPGTSKQNSETAADAAALRARLDELRQLAADLRAFEEAGFATDADRQALKDLQGQIASLEQQLAELPEASSELATWHVETRFRPPWRGGRELKSLAITVWTRPVDDASTVNYVYFGVGGHKFLVFGPEDPPAIGVGPRKVSFDLERADLRADDFRGFSLGMLAECSPQSDGGDAWKPERLEVRVDGEVTYDSDRYDVDKRSLAAVRLVPPAYFGEPAAAEDASAESESAEPATTDDALPVVIPEARSPRAVSLWRPGKAQGIDPQTFEPLPDEVEPIEPERVAVIGYVVFKDGTSSTGYRGIPDVEVTWKAEDGQARSAMTVRGGKYEIELPAGEYLVDLGLDERWEPVFDEPVTVASGMKPKFFVVERSAAQSVVVAGRVVTPDPGGGVGALLPVAGATVTFLKAAGNGIYQVVAEETTGANGRFQIELKAGEYAIEATAQGYFDSPTETLPIEPGMGQIEIELMPTQQPGPQPGPWPPGPQPGPWPPGPQPGPWPPGPWPPGPQPQPNQAVLQVLVLKMQQGTAVPAQGAQVQVGPQNRPTDARGIAEFRQGLQPQTNYNMQVTLGGYAPFNGPVFLAGGFNFKAVTLQPQTPPEETIPLDVFVKRGDVEPPESLPGAQVFVYKSKDGTRGRLRETADGQGKAHFDLTQGPGEYVALASASGYSPGEAEVTVQKGQANQCTIVLEKPDPEDPEVRLEVTVYSPEGKGLVPVEGARVVALPDGERSGGRLDTKTNANGVATFRLPATGKYLIMANADGHEAGKAEIEVQPDMLNELSMALVKESEPIELDVTVFRTEGKSRWPLPGARCFAVKQNRSERRRAFGVTNDEGETTLSVLGGEADYLVVALKPGFESDGRVVPVTADGDNRVFLYLDEKMPEPPSEPDGPTPEPGPPDQPVPTPEPAPPEPTPPEPEPSDNLQSHLVTVHEMVGRRRLPVEAARAMIRPVKGGLRRTRIQHTNDQGQAEFELPPGPYTLAVVKDGYKTKGERIAVQPNRRGISEILMVREGTADDHVPGPGGCSFAGTWQVRFYDNVAGTGQPPNSVRWKIEVSRGKATASEPSADGGWDEFCSGPLSAAGQVWNARRVVGNTLVMRLEDIHFETDCNHFRGKWSGAEPHGFAITGVRSDAAPDVGPSPQPTPPEVADKPRKPAVRSGRIKLQGLTHELGLRVVPGASIDFAVSLSKANPFEARVARADRSISVTQRTEAPKSQGGRRRMGAPTEVRVFTARVNPQARGTSRMVVELKRPWENRASTVYTISLHVVRNGTGDDLEDLIDLWGEKLVQVYCNAQSMTQKQHFHPVHEDGCAVCNSDRCHPECVKLMVPIYRALSEKEDWNLSEAELRKAAHYWRSLCARLPDDKPDQCGCFHEVPSNSHTGW
jgi:5-hydroxyisourate hydrolase-like protein (transthyretin family)